MSECLRPGRLAVTWLGHATFLLRSPLGVRILFDPWLAGNPACPPAWRRVEAPDLVLVTHGHSDHAADVLQIGRSSAATVVAPFELARWFEQKGLRRVSPMNVGGSQVLRGITVTMVQAVHSSSIEDEGRIHEAGPAAGYVLRLEGGLTIYFAGDTALFGDMRLIGEFHAPQLAFLPIGDRFTMGPEAAARACEWLRVPQVVPMHYGTFPELAGTPARLRQLVAERGTHVLELVPGETVEV
jgi:L-ascorbate metabolism protein UlaG (beta-lactamase superfamily)